MEVGEAIRQLRVSKDLTQPQLAEALGIEQSYLSKLENGKYLPSQEVFDRVLEVFDLSVEELLENLDSGSRNQLRRIPVVAAHFERQKRLIIGDRRRWLLISTLLFSFGVAFVYAGHQRLFFPYMEYEYWSDCLLPDDSYAFRTCSRDGIGNISQAITTAHKGQRYLVEVDDGYRWFQLIGERRIDPWQSKVIATLGVLLAVFGLTGLVLETKLSRFQ